MKEKIKKYTKEILVFSVIIFISMNVLSYYRSLDLNTDKLDIKKFTLLDGSDYIVKEDKPLIIYFWATWCPVCKFQSPNIQKLSKDYEVLTIALQSGEDKEIQDYLDSQNLTFNVVNDKNGFFANKFNIKVFPTTVIFDKKQTQSYSDVGYTSTWSLYIKMLLSY